MSLWSLYTQYFLFSLCLTEKIMNCLFALQSFAVVFLFVKSSVFAIFFHIHSTYSDIFIFTSFILRNVIKMTQRERERAKEHTEK